MTDAETRRRKICESYSKDYWENWSDVLGDLVAKFYDRSHVVPNEKINGIFRAVIAFDYIKEHFSPGASILDMGCGIGYNSCFLAREGYQVQGFDGSVEGIKRSKELTSQNGLDPNIFTHSDHTYLEKIPDESIDVAIAMGFIYYLDEDARDYCYRQVWRVLRNPGKFILTCTNQLFNAFSLNDSSLRFWAQMIDEFSPVSGLLDTKNTFDALREKVKVPNRVYGKKSISRRYSIHEDNPLIYHKVVARYGFEVEDILYPDCHVLPPALEAEVDLDALLTLKARTCIQKARDWRGVFMDYEFLAFLGKKTGTRKIKPPSTR
jgi:SAM-dependent methyltransferase